MHRRVVVCRQHRRRPQNARSQRHGVRAPGVSGQVYSVTNPHTRSNPSRRTTYYSYDALGRVTGVTYPDNNPASVSYSGACVTSTDAASKSRTVCADGLGRTISVNEDPSGLNYPTTYRYNVCPGEQLQGRGLLRPEADPRVGPTKAHAATV